jgi:hypothetical protein
MLDLAPVIQHYPASPREPEVLVLHVPLWVGRDGLRRRDELRRRVDSARGDALSRHLEGAALGSTAED